MAKETDTKLDANPIASAAVKPFSILEEDLVRQFQTPA